MNAAGQSMAITIRAIMTPADMAPAIAIMANDLQGLRAITDSHITVPHIMTCTAARTVTVIRMPIIDHHRIIAPIGTHHRAVAKAHRADRVHPLDTKNEIVDQRRAAAMPRQSHGAVPAVVPDPVHVVPCPLQQRGVVVDSAAAVSVLRGSVVADSASAVLDLPDLADVDSVPRDLARPALGVVLVQAVSVQVALAVAASVAHRP
jgi:hypothetical protein